MSIPDLYTGPGTVKHLMNGKTYGWLDASYPWVLDLHSTETYGLPGYREGRIAPKLTLFLPDRIVYQHAPLGSWTGTLVGSRSVHDKLGVWLPMNQKAVSVEVISYSDKRIVDEYGGPRIWVGDWTEDDYNFIGDVVGWLMDTMGIQHQLHAMPAGSSWRYGYQSAFRIAASRWAAWGGLTAHGGVPGQEHWDVGVGDLHRIYARAIGGPVPSPVPPNPTPEEDEILSSLPTLREGDGFTSTGKQHLRWDVRRLQSWLAVAGVIAANTFDSGHRPDGLFGSGTKAAVREFQRRAGITVDGIAGLRTWTELAAYAA